MLRLVVLLGQMPGAIQRGQAAEVEVEPQRRRAVVGQRGAGQEEAESGGWA
ncbi:MAG: hypothetical protein ACYC4L_17560 [Chloroflexota bacterium]